MLQNAMLGGRCDLKVRASDSGARSQGFDIPSGSIVVSMSKRHLLPKSTGNMQENVVPS